MQTSLPISRVWVMPSIWTFRMKPVRDLFVKYEVGIGWVDPFAGEKRGTMSGIAMPNGWLPVNEAIKLPLPNTSWMDNPWPRERFIEWLDKA